MAMIIIIMTKGVLDVKLRKQNNVATDISIGKTNKIYTGC